MLLSVDVAAVAVAAVAGCGCLQSAVAWYADEISGGFARQPHAECIFARCFFIAVAQQVCVRITGGSLF